MAGSPEGVVWAEAGEGGVQGALLLLVHEGQAKLTAVCKDHTKTHLSQQRPCSPQVAPSCCADQCTC